MPDNVLKATIQVTAPGVKETFAQVANSTKAAEGNLNQLGTTVAKTEAIVRQMPPAIIETSLTLKDQRAILAALQKQYAALSTQQAKSRIGLELAADIKIANAEIKRLEAGAVSSFGNIGKSATKGFSAIRQLAFILPGIGIAGIFNVAFTAIAGVVDELFNLGRGFKDGEIAAALFKQSLDDISDSAAKLKSRLDFQDDIAKLKAQLSGLKGQDLDILDITNRTKSNVELITSEQKVSDSLKEQRDQIVEVARGYIQAGLASSKFVELATIAASGQVVPKTLVSQLSANEKALADAYISILKEVEDSNKRSSDAQSAIGKNFLQGEIDRAAKQEELLKKRKSDYEKFVSDTIAQARKLDAAFKNIIDITPNFSVLDSKSEEFRKALGFVQKFDAGKLKITFRPDFDDKDIRNSLDLLGKKFGQVKFDIALPIEFPIDPKVVPATQSEITRILKEVANIKLEPISLTGDISLDIAVRVDEAGKQFGADFANAFREEVKKNIAKGLDLTSAINAALKKIGAIKEAILSIQETFKGIKVDTLGNIGEAIGAALSGGDLEGIFSNFANIIGDGLEDIGKQMIRIGVVASLAKKALAKLFANPALTIAAGVLLIAAGAALKNLLGGGIKGFAKGGRPPVGKDVLIGEKGPEIMRFDRPGTIIPNHKIKDYSEIVKTEKVTSVSQSLVSRYSDSSDKVKEISNTISRIVTTVLDKVAQFQSTTLDKVASFHSSVSSSFEKVIEWSRNKESNTIASKEIRYSVSSDKELRSDHTRQLASSVEKIINSFSQAKESDSKQNSVDTSKNYKEVFRWASDYFRFDSSEKLSKSDKSITDNVSKLVSDIFTSQSHKETDSKVSKSTGLKEVYKLFSSDATDNKFVKSSTDSTSKELYSVAALKEISSTLSKVFEYSTASTETEKAKTTTSTLDKVIHSAFESTYSGLFEKLASVYKTDTSKESKIKDSLVNVRDGKLNKEISRETTKDSKDISTAFQSFIKYHSIEGKTTEKNFHSAFASLVNNSYEKSVASILSRVQDFVSSKEFSSTFSKDISASEKSFVSLSSDVSRLIEATKSHTHHISEGLSFKSLSTENQSHKANYKEIFSESLLVKLDKKQDKEDKEGKPGKEITNFSAIASVIKSIEWGHDHFREFSVEKVITKSDKSLVHKDLIKEANISDLNELVSHESTSSVKELSKLFASNSQRDSDSSTHTDHSVTTVLESVKSFTSKIVDRFTATIERLLSSVVRMQPIPVSSITNITRAASTLNNLTKNVQFRASGGPVSRNAPTIVGEKGWELFTPKVSGHIIPHHKVNEYLKNLYKNTATEKELKVFRSTRNIKDLNLSKIFNRRITNISELTHKELSTIIGKQFAGFRAGGGFVSAGNSVIVGERQLELFVPNTGASIVTNNNTGGSMTSVQGGALKVEGRIRIAGNDLIAVIANAKRSQNSLS